MRLGIFNKVFPRSTLEANLDAVRAAGLASIQLNLESLGGEPMPAALPEATCRRVRAALDGRGIELAALSGTWNVIHPTEGPAGFALLEVLARSCAALGTGLITLSTGTRDPGYMWRAHPDNDSPAAWRDSVAALARAAAIAQEAGVILVFEPEVNNVVNSAAKARRMLDEVASPHLRVVLDGANLFQAGQLPRMRQVLDEAFDLLGGDIRLAHAKDLVRDGDAGHQAAGTGVLDYGHYLAGLDRVGFAGCVILHSLDEARVPASLDHVRRHLPRR